MINKNYNQKSQSVICCVHGKRCALATKNSFQYVKNLNSVPLSTTDSKSICSLEKDDEDSVKAMATALGKKCRGKYNYYSQIRDVPISPTEPDESSVSFEV